MATETFGFARALSVLMAGGVVGRKAWHDAHRLVMEECAEDGRQTMVLHHFERDSVVGWEPNAEHLNATDWFALELAKDEGDGGTTATEYRLAELERKSNLDAEQITRILRKVDPMEKRLGVFFDKVTELERKFRPTGLIAMPDGYISHGIDRNSANIVSLQESVKRIESSANIRNLINQPIDIVATVNSLGERLSFLESRFVPKVGEAIEYDPRIEEMLRYLREEGLMANGPVGVNSVACDCKKTVPGDEPDEPAPNGAGGVCVFTVDMPPEVEGEVRVSTPDNGLKRIVLATEIKSVEQDESDPSMTKVILKDKRRLVVRETPDEVAAAWRFGLDQAWWARN